MNCRIGNCQNKKGIKSQQPKQHVQISKGAEVILQHVRNFPIFHYDKFP